MKTYKIACHACGGHIEFPDTLSGQIINCPHCSLSVALAVPNAAAPVQARPQKSSSGGGTIKLLKFVFAMMMFAAIPGCMVAGSGAGLAAMTSCFFAGLAGFILCRFAE